MRCDQFGNARSPDDEVIREHEGERPAFEVFSGTVHRVGDSKLLRLIHPTESGAGANCSKSIRSGVIPGLPQRLFDSCSCFEMFADRLLAICDDEDELGDSRSQPLFDTILNERAIDDWEDFLRDGFRCGKHPGAKAGGQDDSGGNSLHRASMVPCRLALDIQKVRLLLLFEAVYLSPGSILRKRSKVPPKPAPPEPRINERIRVPEVRVIDEEGRQIGVIRTAEALAMAREREVDLVEVAAQASPPVARLMDFGRFKYEQSKKEREAKKHQVNVQLREVRMKPKIDDHDVDFKTRTAAKLLKQGDKVKVTVMFRGREITHPQIGKALLDRVLASLEDVAVLEKDAMLEGRHMTIILAPDKKKIAAKARAAAEAAGGKVPVEDDEEDEAIIAAAEAAPIVGEDDQDDVDDDEDDDDDETGD